MGEGQRVDKCQRHPFRSDMDGLADTKNLPVYARGEGNPPQSPFSKGGRRWGNKKTLPRPKSGEGNKEHYFPSQFSSTAFWTL